MLTEFGLTSPDLSNQVHRHAPPLSLRAIALSDVGQVRPHNEDYVLMDGPRGLFVLADGMGGYNAGEVASRVACEQVMRFLQQQPASEQSEQASPTVLAWAWRQRLEQAVDRANISVLELSQANADYEGMGTTIVVAVVIGDALWVAHVGDSRAYRWRAGHLLQLTRDHSLLQEQVDLGLITAEQARLSLRRNLVTRAVGIDPLLDTEVHCHEFAPGDVVLLCSDGLTDMLHDPEIAALMLQHRHDLDTLAHALVDAANERGGRDNISVLLIERSSSEAS